jgi:hypothetical protein
MAMDEGEQRGEVKCAVSHDREEAEIVIEIEDSEEGCVL